MGANLVTLVFSYAAENRFNFETGAKKMYTWVLAGLAVVLVIMVARMVHSNDTK